MTKKEDTMMKKKKLFGFTLAELLIVFLIIGFCTVVALNTVKPSQKKTTRYLYMRAYQTLSKAYYNGIIKGYNPFTDIKFMEIEPVRTDVKDTGAQILCMGLAYWINHDTDACSPTALADVKATTSVGPAQLIANNKMAFYITKRLGDKDLYFYVVFIDINGTDKGPNSLLGNAKQMPDIYAFAILDTGRVCPIGRPEYDKDIMTARFAYYNHDGEPVYTRKSLAYYQAKGAAWGYYSAINDATTYQKDEVFSMNDVIRSKIGESGIYKGFPTNFEKPVAVSSTYDCSVGDFETCFIFLDEYR